MSKPLIEHSAESTIHYLPCSIDFDGSSEISSYFMVSENANRPGYLQSHFRGRELHGIKYDLSELNGKAAENEKGIMAIEGTENEENVDKEVMNVKGLCVSKAASGQKELEVIGHFNSIHLWQHDIQPDVNEFKKHHEWLEIANTLHQV